MIVFDASTLILTAKIELLEPFLAASKLRAAIPVEVEKECCGVQKSFDALMIARAVQGARISVVEVKDRKLLPKLRADFSLGRGEAEAIALAVAERARLVGMDDKNGINACKLLGIPFTTAIGILLRMREKGLLTVSDALRKLEALGNFGRYKKSIMEDARQRLEASA